jgi:hypothetical protein
VSSNCWDVIRWAYGFPVIWVNRGQAPLDRLGLTPDLECGISSWPARSTAERVVS